MTRPRSRGYTPPVGSMEQRKNAQAGKPWSQRIIEGLKNLWSYTPNERSIAAQKEMAEFEKQANIDLWKMENAYNHPAEQYERLTGSGFNPALSMGSANAAGQASSLPAYNAPRPEYDYTAPLKILGMFQGLTAQQSQIDQTKAVTNEIRETTLSKRLENILMSEGFAGKRQGERQKGSQAASMQLNEFLKSTADVGIRQNQELETFEKYQESKSTAVIRKKEAELAEKGLFKHDNLQSRTFAEFYRGANLQQKLFLLNMLSGNLNISAIFGRGKMKVR